MSFSLTTRQMRARTKTVTRRTGWVNLKPGAEILAVEKAMGLKKGEKVVAIGRLRVVAVSRERLDAIVDPKNLLYGHREMRLEGFQGLEPSEFIRLYFSHVDPADFVTRIEFEHVEVA